jgi:hypothetical protein
MKISIIILLVSVSVFSNDVFAEERRRNRLGFLPRHFMTDPSISINKLPQSVWDWNIVPPTKPVVGNSGNLIYEIRIVKNPNGELPTGTFTIRSSLYVRMRNFYQFQNAYVMLYAIGMNERYDATDCSHNNFNNETVITCNINIPAITLKGISDGDIIKFYGITLQSYVNYGVNPGMVANNLGLSGGQLVSSMKEFDIPYTENDCAFLSQTFDTGGIMPTSCSFNSQKVCGDTMIMSDARFQLSKKDCQGSVDENYARQIFSNFKLMPQPRGEPSLVLNTMTNVAYLNCSGN